MSSTIQENNVSTWPVVSKHLGCKLPPGSRIVGYGDNRAIWHEESQLHIELTPDSSSSNKRISETLGGVIFEEKHPNQFFPMLQRLAAHQARFGAGAPAEDKELWKEYFQINPESSVSAKVGNLK